MFVAKRLFSEYSMRQVRDVQFDGGIRLPTTLTSQLILVALNEWGNIIELMVFRRRRRVGACVLYVWFTGAVVFLLLFTRHITADTNWTNFAVIFVI